MNLLSHLRNEKSIDLSRYAHGAHQQAETFQLFGILGLVTWTSPSLELCTRFMDEDVTCKFGDQTSSNTVRM